MTENNASAQVPVSQPVFVKALIWSLVATILIALVMGGVGYFVSGNEGLAGGLLGAGAAGIFFALTLLSIVVGNKFATSDIFVAAFFGIVMGGWLLKFVLFIVGSLLLQGQTWLNPKFFFISIIVGALVSLVLDAFIVLRSRMPIMALPEE